MKALIVSLILSTAAFGALTVHTAALYHGNVDSKIFHQQSCRHYNCKNCTAKFESRDAAINAGYRPCKVCKP